MREGIELQHALMPGAGRRRLQGRPVPLLAGMQLLQEPAAQPMYCFCSVQRKLSMIERSWCVLPESSAHATGHSGGLRGGSTAGGSAVSEVRQRKIWCPDRGRTRTMTNSTLVGPGRLQDMGQNSGAPLTMPPGQGAWRSRRAGLPPFLTSCTAAREQSSGPHSVGAGRCGRFVGADVSRPAEKWPTSISCRVSAQQLLP